MFGLSPVVTGIITNKWFWILLVVVSLGAALTFERQQNKIYRLENQKLEFAIDQQQQLLTQFQKDITQIQEKTRNLEADKRELDDYSRELRELLYRENGKKKSLEKLATKKTSLIQKKVNRATTKVFECFEFISEGLQCE